MKKASTKSGKQVTYTPSIHWKRCWTHVSILILLWNRTIFLNSFFLAIGHFVSYYRHTFFRKKKKCFVLFLHHISKERKKFYVYCECETIQCVALTRYEEQKMDSMKPATPNTQWNWRWAQKQQLGKLKSVKDELFHRMRLSFVVAISSWLLSCFLENRHHSSIRGMRRNISIQFYCLRCDIDSDTHVIHTFHAFSVGARIKLWTIP